VRRRAARGRPGPGDGPRPASFGPSTRAGIAARAPLRPQKIGRRGHNWPLNPVWLSPIRIHIERRTCGFARTCSLSAMEEAHIMRTTYGRAGTALQRSDGERTNRARGSINGCRGVVRIEDYALRSRPPPSGTRRSRIPSGPSSGQPTECRPVSHPGPQSPGCSQAASPRCFRENQRRRFNGFPVRTQPVLLRMEGIDAGAVYSRCGTVPC